MSRRNPPRKHTKPVQSKDICILLVNDDDICKNIVADMLDHCRYEAFSYEREMDALNMILQKKDVIELILTNVQRTHARRHGIIEHIEKKTKLKITLMSPDADDIDVSTVGRKGLTVYFMKCLSVDEMNNLWSTALAREKNKKELSSGKVLLQENTGSEGIRDDNEQHGNIKKKPRVVWTKEMHQKFVQAVERLGGDKAFPKKIVELMNIPGLTRGNVASHLQKYRLCMKRAQEVFAGSSYDFTDSFGFHKVQEKFQKYHWNPFETRSSNATTSPFDLNYYKPRSIRPELRLSLLKTIQLKPSHNFSVYGDDTKNILLRNIKDHRVHPDTSFAGLRFARDGKSVVFGQDSHVASSVQQQLPFQEMGNDDSTHCPPFLYSFTQQSSIAPPGTVDELVSISSELSSLTALLADDEPMPDIMTQLQPSGAPPSFDWNKAASQPPSEQSDWHDLLMSTCQQQQAASTPPQFAVMQWTELDELPNFSPPQPSPENMNSDIFSEFTLTPLPPEFCEQGVVGDDGIGAADAPAISGFGELVFDNLELT